MTLSIDLQTQVHQSTFDNLLSGSNSNVLGSFKGVPTGTFTNLEGPVTQFSINPTFFSIETDNPGIVHNIRAELISNITNPNTLTTRGRVFELTVVPENNIFSVAVPLLKGVNQIIVSTVNESAFTTVNVTHYGTFLTSYAREIFNFVQNPLNEQSRALFSKFSSRIPEILIPFQDLYPDPKSLRTLVSRFVTRAYTSSNGSTEGVRDFTSALLGTTPAFIQTKTDQNIFEPDVVTLFNSQLEFGGYEAHTWIPNFEITHWLAFVRLINNARNFYKIQEIGEREILLLANGEPEEHRFDFDDPSASSYREFNVTDFKIVVQILNKLNIRLCAAGYSFDLYITENNPLGTKRIAFDSNIPLDSGDSLDAPSIDPGDDGWVGLTLAGRFDGLDVNQNLISTALDSLFITPNSGSGLPECAYDGFFTQQISTVSGELDVTVQTSSEGSLSSELEETVIESFQVDKTLEDFGSISDWSVSGSLFGSIESSSAISLAGSSSVRYNQQPEVGAAFPIISKNYNNPLDLSEAGGNILYFTVFLGPEAMPDNVPGIPSHPGNLWSLGVSLDDSSGNRRSFTFFKEDLKRGINILPLLLDFPSSSSGSNNWDSSSIANILIVPRPVPNTAGWSDVYLGRLHVLHPQAYYRPSRAKIEFEDIEGIAPSSLFGSNLIFTDSEGTVQKFTGDSSYNTIDGEFGFVESDTIYQPGLYKIQANPGVGTEGFNRSLTALNLQRELGRQLKDKLQIVAVPQVIASLPGLEEEVFVNIFSRQFSPSGDNRNIAFTNPNGTSDLLDFTGFSGGTSGLHEKLLGLPGFSLAQQFTASSNFSPNLVELFLHRVGKTIGTLTVSIHEDNSGVPGNLLVRSDGVLSSRITDSVPNYTVFKLLREINLISSNNYWIVLSGDTLYFEGLTSPATLKGADEENHIIWSKQQGGFSRPRANTDSSLSFGASGFWSISSGEHHYFKVIG